MYDTESESIEVVMREIAIMGESMVKIGELRRRYGLWDHVSQSLALAMMDVENARTWLERAYEQMTMTEVTPFGVPVVEEDR